MPRKPGKQRSPLLILLPYGAVIAALVLANVALPYFDESLEIPFAREISEEGTEFLQINRGYLAPFFPASSPLIPELKSTYVRKARSRNSLRVLCLGGSSMFGVPFQMAATIPSLVRKQLRHIYPDAEIEVINLGASAINSNVIREMVPQYLSLDPDLVLIYTGHNEFYGPEGVGVSWLERHFPALTPWKYRARRLPVVLALQRLISDLGGTESGGEEGLMRQVSGGAKIALSSPEADRIFMRFEENLREIVRDLRSGEVPVILGDLSSNLMFPPFAPRPAPLSETLTSMLTSGHFDAADSVVATGLTEDSTNAFYLYWRGRLSLALGDTARAVEFLERARDNDLLKFRAPTRINDIIHQIGESESVPVLPIDSLMRARSPFGITDSALFCEHLHPTFAGYDLIARAYVQVIINNGVPRTPRGGVPILLPFHADSLSVPWIDLGYGAWSLRALMSRWPFTGTPRRPDVLDTCEGWELEIVKEIYGGRVGWADACLRYADQARRKNKESAAVTALSALVEEYPWVYLFRYGHATALENIGRTSEAIEEYRRALSLKPDLLEARVDFALLLLQERRDDEAERYLSSVLAHPAGGAASAPLRARALYGLAFLAANRARIDSALTLLDESLRLAPGYQAARELRSQITGRSR